MPVVVEQDVLRLEIAVDDILAMQVVESKGDFRGVELRDWVGEPLRE